MIRRLAVAVAIAHLCAAAAWADITRASLEIQGAGLRVETVSVTTGIDIPTTIQTSFAGRTNDDAPAVNGLLAVGELTGPGIDVPIRAKGEQARWDGQTAEYVATIPTDRETLVTLRRAPEKWSALFTTIHVSGDDKLPRYDSGLTAVEILWELVPLTHERPLAFHYQMGADPRVRWRSQHVVRALC